MHARSIVEDGKPYVFAREDGSCAYAGGSCRSI